MFIPSKYQKAIFDWHDTNQGKSGSLVVQAVAGSGKTTTGVIALNEHVPVKLNSAAIAFNKSIADNLSAKLPNRTVKTYHALGLMNITSSFGRVKVDNNKISMIIKDRLAYWEKPLISPIKQLVGLCKNNLITPTNENLYDLADYYNIELNGSSEKIFNYVEFAYEKSLEMINIIDFDDMISMPILLNLPIRKFDYMFVDELQDTNPAQAELVLLSLSNGGVIVGYGDWRQSIYAFRGADIDAMPKFQQRFNADELPLSISYRNPLEIVKLVNDNFPEITFEAFENAIQGEIENATIGKINFIPDDMILCRINAPLVKPCFRLIRNGIKAIIKGRDIGLNLLSMINKIKVTELPELLQRLALYKESEMIKLLAAKKIMQAQTLDDKIETIFAISDGCITIDDVKNRIATVFSDDIASVVFSSIHKAKGLEANRVFILRPDLLPHPLAKTAWQVQQESNLKYVAYTRALQKLTFVMGEE